MPRPLTAADAVLVLLLAAASLVPLLVEGGRSGEAGSLEVVTAAGASRKLLLTEEGIHRFAGPLGETVVEIRGGRVRVKESPCANRLCVREGWQSRAGRTIVCAPNRVGLFLRGKEGGVDAVSR